MNQLISTPQNEWVVAKFNNLPFNRLSKESQYRGALDVITKSHYEDGNKNGESSEVLQFQTKTLLDELSGNLGTLTLPEVQRAFKMGVRGEFGEYFGLCAKTYHKFLKSYLSHPDRLRSHAEHLKLVSEAQIKTSAKPMTEKLKETKESCLRAFKEYKESGSLPLTSWAYYDFLWKELKLINWTAEEKKEIKNQAEKEYTKKLKEDKANRIITRDQYEIIIANLSGEKNRSLINICKKISLKRYFDLVIREGKDLEL